MAETIFLSDADVAAAGDWPDLIEAIRHAYSMPASEPSLPPRTMARGDGAWLRTLSGAPPASEYMGVKLIAASPRRGQVSYLAALFDRTTTELAALLDAGRITATRTAATSALAVDLLAPSRPLNLAVIGSGLEATNHVLALAAVRELASATVYSPTPAKRTALAELLNEELDVPATATDSAQHAVRGADVVIAAARSRDESPTVHGAWLEPGMTIVSIGSTLQEQHEVDVDVIRRADAIYADVPDEVADETGDMLDAVAAGVEFRGKLHSLQELVSGARPGRCDAREVLLYKSVGSALQDLAVAELCFKRARELGLGTPLPATIVPVQK
jgi:ornithine cyclodeaminase/alanine dehydrogenase